MLAFPGSPFVSEAAIRSAVGAEEVLAPSRKVRPKCECCQMLFAVMRLVNVLGTLAFYITGKLALLLASIDSVLQRAVVVRRVYLVCVSAQ